MGPLVTVGIPFRDPGGFLLDAVRSVFAQTYSRWELILIDDGSADGSGRLVSQVRDPRIRLVRDGEKRGLVARLNQIIDLAEGEYIARMDADDLMHPRRLETQVVFLERNRNIDVVDTAAIILDANRLPVGTRGMGDKDTRNVLAALKWGTVMHPTVMARRRWYSRHRYDACYPRAEDRELFLRALPFGGIAHLSDPLYFYVVQGARLSAFLQSYRSERKVLLRHGPGLVGWSRSLALYGRSLAKSLALIAMSVTGFEHVALRRTYCPISEAEAEEAISVCKRIREQSIPGVDEL